MMKSTIFNTQQAIFLFCRPPLDESVLWNVFYLTCDGLQKVKFIHEDAFICIRIFVFSTQSDVRGHLFSVNYLCVCVCVCVRERERER